MKPAEATVQRATAIAANRKTNQADRECFRKVLAIYAENCAVSEKPAKARKARHARNNAIRKAQTAERALRRAVHGGESMVNAWAAETAT